MAEYNLQEQYHENLSNLTDNPEKYQRQLYDMIQLEIEMNEDNMKTKEMCLLKLGELFVHQKQALKIQELIQSNSQLFNEFPKAKTAKIIKKLIEMVGQIEETVDLQIELCQFLINWCTEEKRTYLKNRIQIKLSSLLWQKNQFNQALEITESLIKDVRKADDKHLLVEIELVQCKIYHSLENLAKSKASLTTARANANSIYCAPYLQADLDLMSGVLCAEDKDYKTAYSYFYESFESFNLCNDLRAAKALKYLILTKIMTNNQDEVLSLLNGKYGLKFAGSDLDAMRAVANAHSKKSLTLFQTALDTYTNEISNDGIIKNHIAFLYESLLEKNLINIVKPYSHIQIDHIAKLIQLPTTLVQNKLSEMILDQKIEGTLDQGNNCLIVFDELKCDNLFENARETMNNMNQVVDKLFEKAKLIKN